MELWRKVWREGFAPLLTEEELKALKGALEKDDKHLLQGATTSPQPLQCVADWPVDGACVIGYCGWKGDKKLETVEQVENFFAQNCFNADLLMGEPASCRWFLNWYDDTPRDVMIKELLPEIERELHARSTRLQNQG